MRQTHLNSTLSLKTLDKEKRKQEILSVFEHDNTPRTRRQIKEELGYEDMDSVSPRITEMIYEDKTLEEAGNTFDHMTGKTVQLIKIRQQQLVLV